MAKLIVYLFVLVFLLFTCKSVFGIKSCKCSDSDYPICATNGTHWFLFKNECRLKNENRNRERHNVSKLRITQISNCFPNCDQVCTDEYAPICAKSFKGSRTFQNRCQLDLENCKNNYIWKINHEGECPRKMIIPYGNECPKACTMDYRPICATFRGINQTFSNLCLLRADMCNSKREWQIKHNGECMDEEPRCDEMCPKIYSPICATFNGENRTFSNECILDVEICTTKNQWDILYTGECVKTSPICPSICPTIYQPVCARCGDEFKAFSNRCFLDVENCKTGEGWKFEYDGECQMMNPVLSRPRPMKEPVPQSYSVPIPQETYSILPNQPVKYTFPETKTLPDVQQFTEGQSWVQPQSTQTRTYPYRKPTQNQQSDSYSYQYDSYSNEQMENCQFPESQPRPQTQPKLSENQPWIQTNPYPEWQTRPEPEYRFPQSRPQPRPQPEGPPSRPLQQSGRIPPTSQYRSPLIIPKKCDEISCLSVYDPVCAVFQGIKRTFPSNCELELEICKTDINWRKLCNGPCDNKYEVIVYDDGLSLCSMEYAPVCAHNRFDGITKTFANKCEMDLEIARTGKDWYIISEVECRTVPYPDQTGIPQQTQEVESSQSGESTLPTTDDESPLTTESALNLQSETQTSAQTEAQAQSAETEPSPQEQQSQPYEEQTLPTADGESLPTTESALNPESETQTEAQSTQTQSTPQEQQSSPSEEETLPTQTESQSQSPQTEPPQEQQSPPCEEPTLPTADEESLPTTELALNPESETQTDGQSTETQSPPQEQPTEEETLPTADDEPPLTTDSTLYPQPDSQTSTQTEDQSQSPQTEPPQEQQSPTCEEPTLPTADEESPPTTELALNPESETQTEGQSTETQSPPQEQPTEEETLPTADDEPPLTTDSTLYPQPDSQTSTQTEGQAQLPQTEPPQETQSPTYEEETLPTGDDESPLTTESALNPQPESQTSTETEGQAQSTQTQLPPQEEQSPPCEEETLPTGDDESTLTTESVLNAQPETQTSTETEVQAQSTQTQLPPQEQQSSQSGEPTLPTTDAESPLTTESALNPQSESQTEGQAQSPQTPCEEQTLPIVDEESPPTTESALNPQSESQTEGQAQSPQTEPPQEQQSPPCEEQTLPIVAEESPPTTESALNPQSESQTEGQAQSKQTEPPQEQQSPPPAEEQTLPTTDAESAPTTESALNPESETQTEGQSTQTQSPPQEQQSSPSEEETLPTADDEPPLITDSTLNPQPDSQMSTQTEGQTESPQTEPPQEQQSPSCEEETLPTGDDESPLTTESALNPQPESQTSTETEGQAQSTQTQLPPQEQQSPPCEEETLPTGDDESPLTTESALNPQPESQMSTQTEGEPQSPQTEPPQEQQSPPSEEETLPTGDDESPLSTESTLNPQSESQTSTQTEGQAQPTQTETPQEQQSPAYEEETLPAADDESPLTPEPALNPNPQEDLSPQSETQTSTQAEDQTQLPPQTAEQPPVYQQPQPETLKNPCPDACIMIYAPVCAILGGSKRTFSNRCMLDIEACKTSQVPEIVYDGSCDKDDEIIPLPPKTPCVPCSKNFEPVCGMCGEVKRTFRNKCYLTAENFDSNKNWEVLHEGPCDYESMTPPNEPTNGPCPICNDNYQPICGEHNGEKRTFTNNCFLLAENCYSDKQWTILHEGECTIGPCPACATNYDPVCGEFNGEKKTFTNNCFLQVENCYSTNKWTVLHEGECIPDTPPNEPPQGPCPKCTDKYEPVCGEHNGEIRTFTNNCYLVAENCYSKKKWVFLHEGECIPVSPPNEPTQEACPDCSNTYQPVCGEHNGEKRTFPNNCLLIAENCFSNKKWTLLYDGECETSSGPKRCPNLCPLTYNPVCATYNGIKRTFPNECELNYEAYKTQSEWVILHQGECDYCPTCTDVYEPVCAAYNGRSRTFDNACKVESENCRTRSAWIITSRSYCQADHCPQFCQQIFKPICATHNGVSKTFENKCEMEKEACNTNTNWIMTYPGSCTGQSMPPTEKPLQPVTETPLIPKKDPTCRILIRCLDFSDPVCAVFNGKEKTFLNTCYLHNEKCRYGEDWKIIRSGPCQSTVKTIEI